MCGVVCLFYIYIYRVVVLIVFCVLCCCCCFYVVLGCFVWWVHNQGVYIQLRNLTTRSNEEAETYNFVCVLKMHFNVYVNIETQGADHFNVYVNIETHDADNFKIHANTEIRTVSTKGAGGYFRFFLSLPAHVCAHYSRSVRHLPFLSSHY